MRTLPLVTLIAVSLGFAAVGQAQEQTVLVLLVKLPQGVSGTFWAYRGGSHLTTSWVRNGICVLPGVPHRGKVHVFFQKSGGATNVIQDNTTERILNDHEMDGITPWSGPLDIEIAGRDALQGSVAGSAMGQRYALFTPGARLTGRQAAFEPDVDDPAMGARLASGPLILPRPGDSGTRSQVVEALKNAEFLARHPGPFTRDAVYWSLQYLRTVHQENREIYALVVATENRLRQSDPSGKLFESPAARARYELIRKVVAGRHGKAAELKATELQELFRQNEALLTVREAALRLNAERGFVLEDTTWQMVKEHATQDSSPLLYTANFACARSPNAAHKEVVLRNIVQSDPMRFSAALSAAKDAALMEAKPVILDRIKTFNEPLMKKSAIEYLGAQTDEASLRALGSYVKDPDVQVSLPAAAALRALEARRVRLPQDVSTALTQFSTTRIQDYIRPLKIMPRRDPR